MAVRCLLLDMPRLSLVSSPGAVTRSKSRTPVMSWLPVSSFRPSLAAGFIVWLISPMQYFPKIKRK